MPTFTTQSGREYEVTAKHLIWTPETWDDEEPGAPIRIPLKYAFGSAAGGGLDSLDDGDQSFAAMERILTSIAPNQLAAIRELDVVEVTELVAAWMEAFNARFGVSLGEASPAPDSSPSTSEPQPTTSEPGSGSASPIVA